METPAAAAPGSGESSDPPVPGSQSGPVEPHRRGRPHRPTGQGALHIPLRVRFGFLTPAVLILLAIIGWPILFSIWLSLRNADGSSFVGLHNYASIFSDPATLTAL